MVATRTPDLTTPTYARLSCVSVGSKLKADGGFTCIEPGTVLTVGADDGGLFVPCACGNHYLAGQVEKSPEGDVLIGLSLVVNALDLPLHVDRYDHEHVVDANGRTVVYSGIGPDLLPEGHAAERAAFIVKACNAHGDLIAIVREAIVALHTLSEGEGDDADRFAVRLTAALAKAEGR